MSLEAWPSPDARRGPLPRIDDLPLAEQGYEQEAVRRAFDDFYRHVAQLDATLKTLEAVEAFQREAAELRGDLRSLRSLGLSSPEPSWESHAYAVERERPQLSTTALRIAGEAALLIVVAVAIGIADVRPLAVVAVMAAAVAVVWLCEWLAARARTRVPAWVDEPYAYGYAQPLPPPPEPAGEPAPYVEAVAPEIAVGWSALEVDAVEDELVAIDEPEEVVVEPQELPEPTERRRGWLRRRRRDADDDAQPDEVPQAAHVRVLPATAPDEEAWERGFDGEEPGPGEGSDAEPAESGTSARD